MQSSPQNSSSTQEESQSVGLEKDPVLTLYACNKDDETHSNESTSPNNDAPPLDHNISSNSPPISLRNSASSMDGDVNNASPLTSSSSSPKFQGGSQSPQPQEEAQKVLAYNNHMEKIVRRRQTINPIRPDPLPIPSPGGSKFSLTASLSPPPPPQPLPRTPRSYINPNNGNDTSFSGYSAGDDTSSDYISNVPQRLTPYEQKESNVAEETGSNNTSGMNACASTSEHGIGVESKVPFTSLKLDISPPSRLKEEREKMISLTKHNKKLSPSTVGSNSDDDWIASDLPVATDYAVDVEDSKEENMHAQVVPQDQGDKMEGIVKLTGRFFSTSESINAMQWLAFPVQFDPNKLFSSSHNMKTWTVAKLTETLGCDNNDYNKILGKYRQIIENPHYDTDFGDDDDFQNKKISRRLMLKSAKRLTQCLDSSPSQMQCESSILNYLKVVISGDTIPVDDFVSLKRQCFDALQVQENRTSLIEILEQSHYNYDLTSSATPSALDPTTPNIEEETEEELETKIHAAISALEETSPRDGDDSAIKSPVHAPVAGAGMGCASLRREASDVISNSSNTNISSSSPMFYPLNEDAFKALSELFVEILNYCVVQKDYLTAYELLVAGGFYFSVSDCNSQLNTADNNSNTTATDDQAAGGEDGDGGGGGIRDEEMSEEADIKFLSSTIFHHPFYHNSLLWKAVLNSRIPKDGSRLGTPLQQQGEETMRLRSNSETNNGIRVRSNSHGHNHSHGHGHVDRVILEIHAILYMMQDLGVNSERVLLFIEAAVEEYKLDWESYKEIIKNFLPSLWASNSKLGSAPPTDSGLGR